MQIGVDLASQPDKSVISVQGAGHAFKVKPVLKDFSTGTYAEAVAKLQQSYANLGPVFTVVGALMNTAIKDLIKQVVEHEKEKIQKALLGT